jgi:hypothetical protein
MTQPDQHLRTPPRKTRSSPQKSVSSLSLRKSMIPTLLACLGTQPVSRYVHKRG